MKYLIKKEELVTVLLESNKSLDVLAVHVKNSFTLSDDYVELIKDKLTNIYKLLLRRWKESKFCRRNFFTKHKEWLQETFVLEIDTIRPSNNLTLRSVGRPAKNFEDCSTSSKRRKALDLIEEHGMEKVEYAYNLRAKTSKKVKSEVPLNSEEALALLIDLDLTKEQYLKLRYIAIAHNSSLFPPYSQVYTHKKKCYPENINVNETGASVELQSFVDHSASRILSLKEDLLQTLPEGQLTMAWKWGCDGSSGQAEYKQKFNVTDVSDSDLFIISAVPLKIISKNKIIIWQNLQPSSVRYCRPIKFEFAKESQKKTVAEVQNIKLKIAQLAETMYKTIAGQNFTVKHNFFLTMVDGKVVQAITSTPSAATYVICRAKPTEMNDLIRVREKLVNDKNYEFGLSTLHAWIRTMECVLHIAYNLSFQKWMAKGDKEKEQKITEKQRIQNEFRKLGLIIDVPRQGSGTSNDGNTARRFFSDPEITSQITKVDKRLIERFSVIPQVLSSGKEIDGEKFDIYAFDTAKLYVELYGWYYMPASVHKILIHGSAIINSFSFPIGELSEEAQEARHKNYRNIRLHHSRKRSRIATNEDVIHMLLITSDPVMAEKRKILPKNKLELHPDALNLLLN